jgi:hypothetical protein
VLESYKTIWANILTRATETDMSDNTAKPAMTPGREFFARQIALLKAEASDELIESQCRPDTTLMTLNGKFSRANELKYFREYLKKLGSGFLNALSLHEVFYRGKLHGKDLGEQARRKEVRDYRQRSSLEL